MNVDALYGVIKYHRNNARGRMTYVKSVFSELIPKILCVLLAVFA